MNKITKVIYYYLLLIFLVNKLSFIIIMKLFLNNLIIILIIIFTVSVDFTRLVDIDWQPCSERLAWELQPSDLFSFFIN